MIFADNCSWLKLETDEDIPRITSNRFHLLKYGYPDRPNMFMTADNETHPLFLYLDEQHWIISDRVQTIYTKSYALKKSPSAFVYVYICYFTFKMFTSNHKTSYGQFLKVDFVHTKMVDKHN